MYNVMLADDDYPVIELLSEAIDWERLGYRLMGVHENGLSAWEQAENELPDLLVTDIGMPKMDGLELAARIRRRKANVRIVILSCHSEFQLAQQAMRLNVQEYYLKETLDPDDLSSLLARLKTSLDEERQMNWEQTRLKLLEHETKGLRKEQAIRGFIQQPLLSPDKWRQEAESYGLLLDGEECLPVIGFMDDYRLVKHRFASDQTLHFAVSNVMDEVLETVTPRALHAGYDVKRSLLLFSYKPSLKINPVEQVKAALKQVQQTMQKVLKIKMSFLIGTGSDSPEKLKQHLMGLLNSEDQRFYLREEEVAKLRCGCISEQADLFAYYDEANQQLRAIWAGKREQEASAAAERWMQHIEQQKYPPEMVKDWVLKLLLDIKLKLHSLQHVRPSYTADTLHKEIVEIDSLAQLRSWLSGHLRSIASAQAEGVSASRRTEIAEACKFVSLHIGRRIGLEEVAEHLHLNASYFSRLFKKELGITFIEYVTRMKMERAKELLDQTSHTVGEICELLGYDNQSYFIKTFKAHTGATPLEYRG
ncbi:helix-turn-helix domain-containing protein [Paenibacillus protaetiae]|uniref:Helix-turn-helix domain-containing protein n=1 Tax=Paenibacillus protaetiae TaxID=2509456 RepID=A0A4P6EYR8_9BACL|nr:helix-turn-helix domain-containing protein [Paenibacillus protaetiae]QAY68006.1 helix-turn-helix domain-containing protein [Paenibacillus protaetiae]